MLRYTEVKLFLAIALIIAATCCISSCSGGGTGGGASFGGGSGQSSLAAAQTGNGTGSDGATADSGRTGTFTVTVQMPQGHGRYKSGKVIPYGTKKLKITITGEAFTTPIEYTDDDEDISGTHEINNVPVGLNVATIQVYDGDNSLLAQRKHGFYMQAGTTYDAGTKSLGIAVKDDGTCDPQNIDIPKGSTIYWENWDENNVHTVSMNSGGKATRVLAKVQTAVPDTTPVSYDSDSLKFDSAGTFTYDTGAGRVFVYDIPVIDSITPDKGLIGTQVTIEGHNFSDTRNDSTVAFNGIPVSEYESWSDTSIACKVPSGAGTGKVVVTVRGQNSNEDNVFTYLYTVAITPDSTKVFLSKTKQLTAKRTDADGNVVDITNTAT